MQGLGQSNLNHDFNAYNAANQIWDIVSEAFVAKVAANYLRYRITEAVNARNTATHTLQNNDVHPSTDGYEQMGDTLYCCLMGLES